ncbi:MAG: hypothetical protein J0I32_08925 [Sphingobacteriales bacterium]|nr:hypothetical protein [Sphingobacteriales bacterium]OJW00122.1 MAG: hypothetical protein BGO52_03270 [Sphingobacteriales bacterium 44-61]
MSKTTLNEKPKFKFLWLEITFGTEPLWYRIVLILLGLTALVLIVYSLKEWSAPAIALEKMSHIKMTLLSNFFKGRGP